MKLEYQSIILIIATVFLLSYITEAQQAAAPTAGGIDVDDNKNLVTELTAFIPEGEDYVKELVKRIDETPMSPHNDLCLKHCCGLYNKELVILKKYVEILVSNSEVTIDESKFLIAQEDVEKCDKCMVGVEQEDPEFAKYPAHFEKGMLAIQDLINKYNS